MSTTKLTRFLSYAAAAIFLLIPFQALLITWAGSNFGHIDLFRIWKELILAFLTAGTLLVVYVDKKLKDQLFNSHLTLLIVLFGLLQVGSGIIALQTHKVGTSALIYALMINLRYLVFFLICLVLAAKSDWLRRHWQTYILAPAAAVVGFGLLQQFFLPNKFLSHFGYGPKTIPAYQAVDQKPDYIRVQSTLRGANPLGAYLVVILTVITAAWLRNRRRLLVSMAGVLTIVVLYFTYSRSAWIGAFFGCLTLAFWVMQDKQQRQRLLLGSLITGLILLAAVAIWRNSSLLQNSIFHTSQTSRSKQSSNAVRSQAMWDGARSVLLQPLGEGPGTAGPASVRNTHPARISENYFIQVGQEVGLIGLALFVAINIYVAVLLWKSKDWLARALLAALLGLTIVNFLSHAWADDTLAYVFWGMAGVVLSPSVILNKERKTKHAKTQTKTS